MSTSLVPTTPAADSAEPPPTPTRTLVVYLLVVLVLAGACPFRGLDDLWVCRGSGVSGPACP